MRIVSIVVGIVLAAAMVAGCRTPVDAAPPDQTEEVSMNDWSIRVETEGGITGRGDGAIEVSSDGAVERTTTSGNVCRAEADRAALDHLRDTIESSEPSAWSGEYIDHRGADMFTYDLSLEAGSTSRTVRWNDGGELPADLRAIWTALLAIRNSVDCNPRS